MTSFCRRVIAMRTILANKRRTGVERAAKVCGNPVSHPDAQNGTPPDCSAMGHDDLNSAQVFIACPAHRVDGVSTPQMRAKKSTNKDGQQAVRFLGDSKLCTE